MTKPEAIFYSICVLSATLLIIWFSILWTERGKDK